jgi:hypothetical protein
MSGAGAADGELQALISARARAMKAERITAAVDAVDFDRRCRRRAMSISGWVLLILAPDPCQVRL